MNFKNNYFCEGEHIVAINETKMKFIQYTVNVMDIMYDS